MNPYILMLGMAACTPNPEITSYAYIEGPVFETAAACDVAARAAENEHAYCMPHSYAPATSIRPRPRPQGGNDV